MKPLSDRDCAILAQHAAGSSFKEISEAMKVGYGTVRRIVEFIGPMHTKGRDLLAADPENIEGLRLTGVMSARAYSAIAEATYKIDVPNMGRLSDVAAQGRECVACFPGIGPGVMSELDTLLARFGLAWNPRPRPFAYRTDKNKHPLLRLWDKEREWSDQQDKDAQFWNTIVRRVAAIERAVGTGVLRDAPGRDSMEGITYRLSFLTGYLEGHFERRQHEPMRDITPDDQDDNSEDLETAGNLVCLPGIKLSDVLHDGGQP